MQVAVADPTGPERWEDVVVDANWQEKALLVGVSSVAAQTRSGYLINESLNELERLANSAGLQVEVHALSLGKNWESLTNCMQGSRTAVFCTYVCERSGMPGKLGGGCKQFHTNPLWVGF